MRYDVNENHMLQEVDEQEVKGYDVRVFDYEDGEIVIIYIDADDDISKTVEHYMKRNDLEYISYDWEIIDEFY